MADWRRLCVDPELKAMWDSPQMKQHREALERGLLSYRPMLSATDHAYHQGLLEGLKFAQEFPEKMLAMKEKKEGEETATGFRQRFAALRFGGV